MKRIMVGLAMVLVLVGFSGLSVAHAQTNKARNAPYEWNGYYECTAYVDWVYGAPYGAGNAWTWTYAAERDGWNYSEIPPQGQPAILVFQPYVDGASYLGHVTFWTGYTVLSDFWGGSGTSVINIGPQLLAWEHGSWYNNGIYLPVSGLMFIWYGSNSPPRPDGTHAQNSKGMAHYRVVAGDTLFSITQRIWKNANWFPVYATNKVIIGNNPNLLFPGEILLV